MAATGLVRVVMQAETRALRAALTGATDEARRADRATVRSARTADAERARSAQDVARGATSAERARADAVLRADSEIVRSARTRAREEERLSRNRERQMRQEISRRRQLIGGAVTGAVGAAGALIGQASAYGSAIGIPSRDAMVSNFLDSQQRLIRLAGASRGAFSSAQLQSRVSEVSVATNTDPAQLVRALEVAQSRFSDLQGFADNLEAIARAAQVGGGDIADYVGALGEFRRQMGVTSADSNTMLASMIQMMDAGSIEAGDFAANFGPMMNQFHNFRTAGGGIREAREFTAMGEALGSAGIGGAEGATAMGQVMGMFERPTSRQHVEQILGDQNVFDAQGRLTMDMGTFISRLSEHREFTSPEGMRQVFGRGEHGVANREGSRALQALVNLDVARREGREGRSATVAELMASSAGEGQTRIDSTVAEMMDSTSGRAISASVQSQANFSQHGEQVVDLMTRVGGAMAQLETEYPMLTEAMTTLRNAAAGAGMSLGALALFNGGGAAAGGGAAGAIGTALTTGTVGTVLGSAAAAGLGAAAAAGAVTLYAAGAGGDSGDTSFAGGGDLRYRTGDGEARGGGQTGARQAASLAAALDQQEGARAAYISTSRGLDTTQRAALASAAQGRIDAGVALTPDTIRQLAEQIGRHTGTTIARGAPADGRTSGVPGRTGA